MHIANPLIASSRKLAIVRFLQSKPNLYLLELMEGQTKKEDNEEMVSVPENLKVGATDELQGRGDHQEQGYGDDVTSDTSSCHKTYSDGVLCAERDRERERGGGEGREKEVVDNG